jgi:hypothetical protein
MAAQPVGVVEMKTRLVAGTPVSIMRRQLRRSLAFCT